MKDWSYKKKFYYLLSVFIFSLVIIYTVAISSTIQQKNDYKNKVVELKKTVNAPNQIDSLYRELQKINLVVGNDFNEQKEKQEILIDKISKYCQKHNTIIKNIPEMHEFRHKDYIVETTSVTVQGNYKQLLYLLFKVEKEFNIGKLASVVFKSEKEPRTGREYLIMTMYVQNLKMAENENIN